jgi:hypothetical protein
MPTPVPTAVPTVVPPSTGTLSPPATGTAAPASPFPSSPDRHPRARVSRSRTAAHPRGILVGGAVALGLLVMGGLLWMRGAGPHEPVLVESPSPSPPADLAGQGVTPAPAPGPAQPPTIEAPVPLAPRAQGELSYGDPARTATAVSWRPVSGATSYHLMLARAPGFSPSSWTAGRSATQRYSSRALPPASTTGAWPQWVRMTAKGRSRPQWTSPSPACRLPDVCRRPPEPGMSRRRSTPVQSRACRAQGRKTQLPGPPSRRHSRARFNSWLFPGPRSRWTARRWGSRLP